MRTMLRYGGSIHLRIKENSTNVEKTQVASTGWSPYFELSASCIATVSASQHMSVSELFSYTLTAKRPLASDSFSRKYAEYLTSKNPNTTPALPPDAASRCAMLQHAQALLMNLPMSEAEHVVNYGLWSRIIWQYETWLSGLSTSMNWTCFLRHRLPSMVALCLQLFTSTWSTLLGCLTVL